MTAWPSSTASKGLQAGPSINDAPMCCCEGAETETVIVHRRLNYWWWTWFAGCVGCLAVALVIIGVRIARASETADHMRPHEIVLVLPLPPADQPVPGTPYVITISGSYVDKTACEKAKQRVRVPAGKVVCSIVNPWRAR